MNTNRTWANCKQCNSAVISTHINPKSQLCKVCDSYRLTKIVYVTRETNAPELNQLAPDFGFDQDLTIDGETGFITELDKDGNEMLIDTMMTSDDVQATTRHNAELEKRATALLAKIEADQQATREAFAAWAQWYCDLKASKDVVQVLANNAREANYVWLRDVKDGYAAASKAQVAAMIKLGWDKDVVRNMRLTIAEAARLLQRGPRWLY